MLLASGFHTIILDPLNERATQFKVELAAGVDPARQEQLRI
jgi:hypothetical protein